jgi:hypothetical protein
LFRPLVVAAMTVSALLVPSGAAQAAAADPATPTRLSVSTVACTDDGIWIGTTKPQLSAVLAVDTVRRQTPTYALWPLGHEDQRVEWQGAPGSGGQVYSTPAATLVNGESYRFEVRSTDSTGAVSPWSPGCTFTVDTRVPHAPAVTSTDYPTTGQSGGPGIPGTFTFEVTGGDTDVVAFRWGKSGVPINDVPVDATGRATLTYAPTGSGFAALTVQAIDRTGNGGAQTTYEFTVRSTEPRLTDLTPGARPGQPHTYRAAPGNLGGLVSYDYRLDDGPVTTVPADADGVAEFTFTTPTTPGNYILTVVGHTATGLPAGPATRYLTVQYPAPTITSPDFPGDGTPPPLVGTEITLVFHPGWPEVTQYYWSADGGETETRVRAGADGTATVTYTPDSPYLYVRVRGRDSDGNDSEIAEALWELREQ